MSHRIPFQRPELPAFELIGNYFRQSQEARYFSNGGPCVRQLEARMASYLGVEHACLGANATLSLMIAARAVFGSEGGIVLTPSFTFAATATALEWTGFRPHFIDTDPTTFQMCPISLKSALSTLGDQVVGILACGSFGIVADADQEWLTTADEHGVPVIFDSAAGIGSRRSNGELAGSRGRCEVFSMHATKPFAVGEGSLIATNDAELADRMRRLHNFGFSDDRVVEKVSGINAKMSELTGAVGLAALDGFPEVLVRRTRALQAISDAYQSVSGEEIPVVAGTYRSALQFVPLHFRSGRDEIAASLALDGIETRLYYHPLHLMGAFSGYSAEALDGTARVWGDVLSFPMANDLSADECRHLGTSLARAVSAAA